MADTTEHTPPPDPAEQQKNAACNQRITTTIEDLQRHADTLERLRRGPLEESTYVELIRELTRTESTVRRHRESLAFLATAEPRRVPINTLAQALDVSINTFRSWMPRLNTAVTPDDPFQER